MTDQFYTNSRVLDRLHGGPLGSCNHAFAEWLSAQGYAKFTITYGLRMLGALSCWMQQRGISVRDLDEKTDSDFLRERWSQYRIHPDDVPVLNLLLKYLRQSHILSPLDQ